MTSILDSDETSKVLLMAKVDHDLTNLPEVPEGSSNKVMPEFATEPQLEISKLRDNWIEFNIQLGDLYDNPEKFVEFSENFNPNGYFSKDNKFNLIRPAKLPPPGEEYDDSGNLVDI